MNTIRQWIDQACATLRGAGYHDSARLDADLLASFVTGHSRTYLFAHAEQELEQAQIEHLNKLLSRRLNGEPIAYLTGQKEFWSMPFKVTAGVLVPRPDTETLVEKTIELEPSAPEGPIIELGTGSGAIAVALANEISTRQVIAVERSTEAMKVASINIKRLAKNTVCLVQSNWLDAINTQSIAVIVSNPPYLAAHDPHLPDLQYEPPSALVSGVTGLEDIEHIISESIRVARPGCLLVLEHGCEQGQMVRTLLTKNNFTGVATGSDLAGLERISYGYAMDTYT
ncbi:MAG: peptide chain release factor N(5)-glutamine methyltransferase [Granulosicoccus sp.]